MAPKFKIIAVFFSLFLIPSKAWAIVPHAYQGIYIHQMGHIFFIISCLFISWVIFKKNLYKEKGWKYILFAEAFFALWNIDAFIGHISEYWIEPSQIIGNREGWDYFKREIILEGKEYLYYITKHDHILLVPAMFMFYLGLREHLKKTRSFASTSAILPLLPIILVDIVGSFLMIVLSLLSLFTSVKLYKGDRENTLWNYMLWLSVSYVIFSFSRSLGHILNRILVPTGYEYLWKVIEPYSGSLNTFTFIVIGAVSMFFFRAYEVYLIISSDNQKIEKINADLLELNQELEKLVTERTMSLMALTVADKVRNPAAVIGWTCRRMLEKKDVPDKLDESLRDVIYETEKLESIVKDFETLLKSKQSIFKYDDINEIVKEAVSIVEKEASEKGVKIVVNVSQIPLKINSQRNLLRSAILHILRNSIEATSQSGSITITTSSEKNNIILSISDTGIGISDEYIDKIFDPFFSTKKYRFGMGLPLVKQIVSEHLGEINVRSELGKGTTFIMVFPTRWKEKN